MSLRHSIRTAVALIAAMVLACGDPVGPSGAAFFVLRRVGSDSLPAVIFLNETARITVFADTLFLGPNDSGSISGLRLTDYLLAGRAPEATRLEKPLTYRLKNGRVEIEFVCAANELCAAPPHLVGRFANGGLRVDYALGMRVPQYYEPLVPSTLRRDR